MAQTAKNFAKVAFPNGIRKVVKFNFHNIVETASKLKSIAEDWSLGSHSRDNGGRDWLDLRS